MKWKKMGLRASHSACATPSSTVMPAARSCSQPRPATSGLGSADPTIAGVAAWFEGYVEGRAFGRDVSSSAVGKSGALRMKIAAACVPAFRDNFAIAHEHGSYERIGIRESCAAACELNSSAHVFDIGFAVCHGCLLLMPRIRAFAEGRGWRLAISVMRALMRMMSKSVADQLAWVWSGWAMDARRRSALASPNSRNPANTKSPETRTFQGL